MKNKRLIGRQTNNNNNESEEEKQQKEKEKEWVREYTHTPLQDTYVFST